MIEFSLAEMVLISPNITAMAHNTRRISRSENSKLNLVSLQDAGVFIVTISEVRVFILLFVLP